MIRTEPQSESKENARTSKGGIEEEIRNVFLHGVKDYLNEKLPKGTIKEASLQTFDRWEKDFLASRGLEWSPWMRSYVENSSAMSDLIAQAIDVPLAKVPFLPENPSQRLFISIAQRGPILDKIDGFIFRNYPWILGVQQKGQ